MDDRLGRIERAVIKAVGEWGDIEAHGGLECQVVTDDPQGNGDIEVHVPLLYSFSEGSQNDAALSPLLAWEHFRITVERFEVASIDGLAPEAP